MTLCCGHPGGQCSPSEPPCERAVPATFPAEDSEASERTRGLSSLPLQPLRAGSRLQCSDSTCSALSLSHKHLPSYLSKHPQKAYLIGAFQIFQVINGIYTLSVLTVLPSPKPKLVSTEHHISTSYKRNTLQLSLFPLLLFHPGFLVMGFALVTPSLPNSFAHFKAAAFLLSQNLSPPPPSQSLVLFSSAF